MSTNPLPRPVEPLWYPQAIWQPLPLDHSDTDSLAQRNQVVLHIAEGGSAAGIYATFLASKKPNRVSSHFAIDRDGTVYQYVSLDRTAWHASQVNSHSVGIEHAALSQAGANALNHAHSTDKYVALPATEAQYLASARLCAWLCVKLKIPADRNHLREHCEASPRDGHVLCCHGALDPDRVAQLAQVPAQVFQRSSLPVDQGGDDEKG